MRKQPLFDLPEQFRTHLRVDAVHDYLPQVPKVPLAVVHHPNTHTGHATLLGRVRLPDLENPY